MGWLADTEVDVNYDEAKDVAKGRETAALLDQALYGKPVILDHLAGKTREEMDQLDKAADYTDEWFHIATNAGSVAIRTFYICTAKWGQERCRTLATSSRWLRKQADPLAYKQVWYCPVCGAKYRTTFGVILQMISGGQEKFVRATFPEHGMQQVKWTSVQRSYRQATTAEELLAAIPEAALAPSVAIQPVDGTKGAYSFNDKALMDIPCFKWAQIFERDFLADRGN